MQLAAEGVNPEDIMVFRPYLALVLVLAACAGSTVELPSEEAAATGTFASVPGTWSGDTFYASAQYGVDLQVGEMPADFESEIRQAMENLGSILRDAGLSYSDVVKSNVYITDGKWFQAMNGVYKSYFPENPPCRTTVFVPSLPHGAQFSVAVIATRNQDRQYIYPEGVEPSPEAVFSPGILVGDTLYLSGQGSRHYLTKELPEGGIDAHVKQSLENLEAVLKQAGMDLSSVVKSHVYLTDMGQYDSMNQAYTGFFSSDPPARTTVAVSGLPGDPPIEITLLAVKDSGVERKVVRPEGVEVRPMYSTAVQLGDLLFLSGKGGSGGGSAEAQTRDVMEFLRNVLETGGLEFSNVIEGKIYLADMSAQDAVAAAYSDYFGAQPARTLVGVEELPGENALVEITLLASGLPIE
ncbi:MAG: RidA family protein [Acidobacteriota bacterium]